MVILFLFLFSGFSGLIYESIWTHYLKLLLGHSAYAQTLVMSIFMGGLAIGAWITSYYLHKIKNLLLTYALIEFILGICAFLFHDAFQLVNNFLFNNLPVQISTPVIFSSIKWFSAAFLILPQSILLGATFPLISSGLLQLTGKSKSSGAKFSLLYFNNSLGAAIGALVSGFVLIQAFGLPGTIVTAGWINIFIALSIVVLVKVVNSSEKISLPKLELNIPVEKNNLYILLLAVAFFTGVASFCYEIAWIRMLTLVLGATTHAFELMISAFILGLALGSFWIKRYIDKLESPIRTLAQIQILMALSALMTLIFYDKLFDLMIFFLNALNKNEPGYALYLFVNHFFALLLMLPATFFAGMTLPLITNILYEKQKNDRTIGHVYAINTLGAIAGIIFSINMMPLIQTQGIISAGALLDITLGIVLFGTIYFKTNKIRLLIYSLIPLVIFQIVINVNNFNPLKVASSVFRSAGFRELDTAQNIFHKDGKLSTVGITRYSSGAVTLTTNGKPDASVNLYGIMPTIDESTMILIGALPLAIDPAIKNVANIGMGSGQTVQSLLSFNSIKKVDTIEIEKSVIEALPEFRIYSQAARYDKRSHIYIDDAKSFFATNKNQYDLIVSEPSNPWVSGTSSLFSNQFYHQVKNNLATDGIFSQWLQLYEINLSNLAPIFKALSENFENYVVYNTNHTDILIFATDKKQLNQLSADIFRNAKTKSLLNRIKVISMDDISIRYIGDKKLLQPLFDEYPNRATSDYYPQLDYAAAKSLYLQESAIELSQLNNYIYPVSKYLDDNHGKNTPQVINDSYFPKTTLINNARILQKIITSNNKVASHKNTPAIIKNLAYFIHEINDCNNKIIREEFYLKNIFEVANATLPHLDTASQTLLWDKLEKNICHKKLSTNIRLWISLHRANAQKKYKRSLDIAQELLSKDKQIGKTREETEYLITSILFAYYKMGDITLAKKLWSQYSRIYTDKNQIPLSIRLLISHINKH